MTEGATAARIFGDSVLSAPNPPVLPSLLSVSTRPREGRALRRLIDRTGLLLRVVREAEDDASRRGALTRMAAIARRVDAEAVIRALDDLSAFSADDAGEEHLDAIARLHAAAAEACAAAAAALISRSETSP